MHITVGTAHLAQKQQIQTQVTIIVITMIKALTGSAALGRTKRQNLAALNSIALTTTASRVERPKRLCRGQPPTAFPYTRRTFSANLLDRGGAIIPGTSSPIHLPPADDPVGLQLYKKAIYCPVSGVLRTSAHVGTDDHNQKADGVVGDSVTPEEARIHARNSGLRLLATLHDALDGDLGRVEQVLHLKGMVKSTSDFAGHAKVIDGCSEVLAEALGQDAGIGTRECFGVGSLGATVACTIEVRVSPPK